MFEKKAHGPHYWPTVVNKVKALGLRPEIVAMLNNVNQIVWEQSPPADNPNAIAYVSSEDKNNDGKIDKIHFVLSKFPPNAGEDEINSIVEMVAKTLVHEYGHIEDFDSEKGFPGGEGAAEAAERQAESLIQGGMKALASIDAFGEKEMTILGELQKIANRLDEIGETGLADRLDVIVAMAAIRKEATNLSRHDLDGSEYAEISIIDILEEFGPEIRGAKASELYAPAERDWDEFRAKVGDLNRPLYEGGQRGAFFDWRGNKVGDVLETILAHKINGTPLPWATASEETESMAKAERTSNSLEEIQKIIGASADGKWGRNTAAALRTFLTRKEKYLLPVGTAVDSAMNWGKGHSLVSVKGVSRPGEYAGNWGGLLKFLEDIESADVSELALLKSPDIKKETDTRSPQWTDQSVDEPEAEAVASNAMDDVVSSLSSEFTINLPKVRR
jgi:hypothetical protein